MGLSDIVNPTEWVAGWREDYSEFSWWRKGMLRLAVFALIAGIGVRTVFGGWGDTFSPTEANERANSELHPALMEVAPIEVAGEADTEETESKVWSGVSGFLMKCGLSFLIAFLVAYLMRKAIKVGIIVLLTVTGGLFALNALGVLDLPFETWSDDLKALADSLEGKGGQFLEFIKGSLPSGVTSGAGLFAGFRRS